MKEFKYGNSTVFIYSKFALMTKQEQREWYKKEWENNNPYTKKNC